MSKASEKAAPVQKFFLTKKGYNPKVAHTAAAWAIVQKTISTKGATREQLVKALTFSEKQQAGRLEAEINWKNKESHVCFIGYMAKLKVIELR